MADDRKRLWFQRHNSAGHFPDGRLKLDVFFEDSDGTSYVWTPNWANTRSFFTEASRVEQLNVPRGSQVQAFAKTATTVQSEGLRSSRPNLKLLCLNLSDVIRGGASGNQIDRVAYAVFDFDRVPHEHPGITSGKWQSTYDWIMTLIESGRPSDVKASMLTEFVEHLTAEDSEARSGAQQVIAGIREAE